MLLVIPSVLLAASLKLRSLRSPHKFIAIQMFYWNYEILKNHPRKRVFRNKSLDNLENVLQRNLRTDRASECIFRVSEGTNFENFSTRRQTCSHLPKKTLSLMVPRGDMCTSLISLSKITSNLPQITHSAKETRQQKEPWGRLGDWGWIVL